MARPSIALPAPPEAATGAAIAGWIVRALDRVSKLIDEAQQAAGGFAESRPMLAAELAEAGRGYPSRACGTL